MVEYQDGTKALGFAILSANDVIPLDYRGYTHPRAAIFHATLHAYHFTERTNKHLGSMGNFGGKRQGHVKFGASLNVLFEDEVKTTGGDVASLSFLGIRRAFRRHADDYG